MKILDFDNLIENDDESAEEKFQEILKKISNSPDLEYLVLKGNGLTNEQLSKLKLVLLDCPELKVCDLSYNCIDDDGISFINNIITMHPKLKDMNLEYNKVTDKGVIILAENSQENMKLKYLKLSLAYNPIFQAGLEAASNHLSPTTTLSLLADGKIRIKVPDLVEQCRQKAANELQLQSETQFTPYQNFTKNKETVVAAPITALSPEQKELAVRLAAQSDEVIKMILLQASAIKQEKTQSKEKSAPSFLVSKG